MRKLIIGIALMCCSCENIEVVEKTERLGNGHIQVIEFKGHEYLSYDGDGYNGGFCHSEACKCKSLKSE